MNKSDFRPGQEVVLLRDETEKVFGVVETVGYRYITVNVEDCPSPVRFDIMDGFRQMPIMYHRSYELFPNEEAFRKVNQREKDIEWVRDVLFWDDLDLERMSDEDLEDFRDLVKKYRKS